MKTTIKVFEGEIVILQQIPFPTAGGKKKWDKSKVIIERKDFAKLAKLIAALY